MEKNIITQTQQKSSIEYHSPTSTYFKSLFEGGGWGGETGLRWRGVGARIRLVPYGKGQEQPACQKEWKKCKEENE
jgi:hypothetical protein